MEVIVANVDHIKFDIDYALEQQYGALPLPFPGMDSKYNDLILSVTTIKFIINTERLAFQNQQRQYVSFLGNPEAVIMDLSVHIDTFVATGLWCANIGYEGFAKRVINVNFYMNTI